MEVTIHQTTGGKCRVCKTFDNTVKQVVSECPKLAEQEYIERCNRVSSDLLFALCQFFKYVLLTNKWYERVTTSEEEQTTFLYEEQIIAYRTIPANKPILIVNSGWQRYVIDVAILSDRNIIQKRQGRY